MKEPYNILKDEDIDKTFDNLYNLIDEELEKFETANNVAAKKFNNEETPIIVNHLLFFRAHFLDITIAIKQALKSSKAREKNLAYRSLALHLYEFIDDSKSFLGKRFREALLLMPNNKFLLEELNELKVFHKKLVTDYMPYLGTVRHNTIAHKEQNTKYFRQVVKELDVKIIQVAWVITSIFFATIRNYHVNMAESLDEDYYEFIKNPKNKFVAKFYTSKQIVNQLYYVFALDIEADVARILCRLTSVEMKQLQAASKK